MGDTLPTFLQGTRLLKLLALFCGRRAESHAAGVLMRLPCGGTHMLCGPSFKCCVSLAATASCEGVPGRRGGGFAVRS